MTFIVGKFIRKPFPVEAVKVTQENMGQVSNWCDGEIDKMPAKGDREPIPYIRVRVLRPLNERQTRAFVGDYVLYTTTGYKVYTEKAFKKDFEEVEGMHEPENNGEATNGTGVVVDGTPLSQEALGLLKGLSELSDLLPKKTA